MESPAGRVIGRIEEIAAARGAGKPHWVLCNAAKRPVAPGWQKKSATAKDAVRHLDADAGNRIGLIPASLGCVVIDVDHGGDAAASSVRDRLGEPLGRIRTRSGGVHLWYRCAKAADGLVQGNAKWATSAGDGDIRGGRGFVVVWDLGELAGIIRRIAPETGTVDVSALKEPEARGPADVAAAEPGARNDTLNSVSWENAVAGVLDRPAMVRAGMAAGLPAREAEATVASAAKAGEAVRRRIREKTPEGLATMLDELGIRIRWNIRSSMTEWAPPGRGWRELDDMAEDSIAFAVAGTFRTARNQPMVFSREGWQATLNAVLHARRTDPFLEWLAGLPEWDGVPRLRLSLSAAFAEADAGDPALAEWAGASVFMAAVLRAFSPGAKHDEMVVLIGPQGCGKSTWCRNLADTDAFPQFYTDNLHMGGSAKEKVEAILGTVVVECSEMAGTTRAELETLKAFISRQSDRVRLSYRRNPGTYPRRSVIVGTTNETSSLPNDPSGNRRFVPVRVSGDPVAVAEWLTAHRKQLWAESVHRIRAGEPAHLPPELRRSQADAAETHRRTDEIVEEQVAEWLKSIVRPEEFTLRQAIEAIGYTDRREVADQRLAHRVARALETSGAEKSRPRRAGKQVTVWVLPRGAQGAADGLQDTSGT